MHRSRIGSTLLSAAAIMTFVTSHVAQTPVSVKLTTNALGIGSVAYNDAGVADADVPGKIVLSPLTGTGNILTIQQSGVAGPGTLGDPLLVTVTARTHLDTLSGLPAAHDYVAGIIYLTNENAQLPDGKNEGLGVRAITVDGATVLRVIDPATGRPCIEGSKDVSGGTGPEVYNPSNPNGTPHVDEEACFDFNNPDLTIRAVNTSFLLSKFDADNRIQLFVRLTTGETFELPFEGTGNTALFSVVDAGAKLWRLHIAGVPGIGANDLLDVVCIRAIDNNPQAPTSTAEHFLITGMTTVVELCSAPAYVQTLGTGCGAEPVPTLVQTPLIQGVAFTSTVTSGAPFAPGILFVSFSGGAPFQVGGCQIFLDLNTAVPILPFTTDENGTWIVGGTVPMSPNRCGVGFIAQAAIFAPGGPLGNIQITNAVLNVVGF